MVVKMSAVLTDRQLSIQPTVQPDTVRGKARPIHRE